MDLYALLWARSCYRLCLMLEIKLYCYRYYAWCDSSYDDETVWADVQSWGGSISIRGDCVDFFVPAAYISFFILKYPELTRQRQLEYV